MPGILNTDKLIVLAYAPGAGGKFVANCLSLSRGVVPMLNRQSRQQQYLERMLQRISERVRLQGGGPEDVQACLEHIGACVDRQGGRLKIDVPDWASFVLAYFVEYGDRDARLDWIEATLPAPGFPLSRWTELELDATALYGFRITQTDQLPPGYLDRPVLRAVEASGLYHFAVLHKQQNVAFSRHWFPRSIQIRFVNVESWIAHCQSLGKSFGQDTAADVIECTEPCTEFDVASFFSRETFLAAIEALYETLGLEDFPPEHVASFHEKYLSCHGLSPR